MSNILLNNERAVDTIIKVIGFAEMAENTGSSAQLTIGKIPAGGAVLNAGVYEKTALVGASDITLDCGTTGGDPDEFIDEWDADAGTPAYNSGESFTTNFSQPVGIATADTDILVEINGTTGSLTAGEVVVVLEVINPGKFA